MLELGAKTRCADMSLLHCAWSYIGPGTPTNHLLVYMPVSFPHGQCFQAGLVPRVCRLVWAVLEEDVGNCTVAMELRQDVVTSTHSVPPSTVLFPKAWVPLRIFRASRVNTFVQPKFKSPKS